MRARSTAALTTWRTRLFVLASALHAEPPGVAEEGDLAAALAGIVDVRDRRQIWLALAVLTGRLPEVHLVQETARRARFDAAELFEAVRRETTAESLQWTVEVESDRVIVDVAHTATTILTTGIQRVVREVAKRWARGDNVRLVTWMDGWQAMRDLDPGELSRVRDGVPGTDQPPLHQRAVVVPWNTTYLLTEVSAEVQRAARLRALGRFSVTRNVAICYDLIPVTSSETAFPGMTGVFAHYMSALKYFDRICTISEATAREYDGWRVMLRASGLVGPEVRPVLLPASVGESDDAAIAAARERLLVGTMPLVLVVGSHEPRKNHLAILHAAELLWREGHRFSLSFIGGNSWRSEEFTERLETLQHAGRPVETISRADDELLWSAYRLARFTVFPSLNEGFGLPVAESLAVGTPVITSRFGSTLEIAESGGALLIDPREDDELTSAMRVLLTDDATLARLRSEALARPASTWDRYAADVWESLNTDASKSEVVGEDTASATA